MRISVKLCLYEIFLKFGPRWWLRRYDHEFKSRATAAYIERWQENVQRFSCFSIKMFFFKNGPFPASFSLFLSFQYTVDSKQMFNIKINFCRWLDSNCGPLLLEVTALPTEPQPLPNFLNGPFKAVWPDG